jgi:hydroxyethylthiazole kinase-like uncharacterized protein yjeF
MEHLLTAEEMRDCDREAIESRKVSGESLMEKASICVAKVASKLLGDVRGKRIAVICGKGNNGGDGFGASLYLSQMGAHLKVYVVGPFAEITGDAKVFFDKLKLLSFGNSAVEVHEFEKDSESILANHFDLIIDAVLGTGLSGEPKEAAKKAIELMAHAGSPVLSVDIPSGIDSTRGTVYSSAPIAAVTVTMGKVKRGLIMNEGRENSGKLFLADIGLPSDLEALKNVQTFVINCKDVQAMLPRRKAETHKHAVGKIFGLVGSTGLTGAGIMVGRAAMRAGAGAVILGVPSELNTIYESQLIEVMTVPLPQTGDGTFSLAVLLQVQKYLEWADVLVVGPGISKNQETAQLVIKLLRGYDKTVVIDADALNAIADQPSILRETHAEIIMTPHHGEFSRLIKFSAQEIAKNRIEFARKYAKENNLTLVLKGAPTVIASKDGKVYVNVHGNPGMATAGTGDVLTGIIAAMVGQKLSPVDAAIAGVYLHSVAGDIAAESKGIYSLIATDIIETLPDAFRKIENGEIVEFEKIS